MTVPLGLVVIKKDEAVSPVNMELIAAMAKHIAIAFENARLYNIAITDELTMLFTQRHFRHVLEREFDNFERYGESLSLLMIDVDDFKPVNDTYGHIIGDAVLRGIADCVKDSIRATDIAFRYGGEELAVILPATGVKGAMEVSERIRTAVKSSVFDEMRHRVRVTVSIGVSVCPLNASSMYGLKVTADEALYEAKKAGKDRTVQYEGCWEG